MSLVNHPEHYNLPNRRECIEEIRELYGDRICAVFCLTNAYKYLYRAGNKAGNSREQDMNKAWWYFNYADKKLNQSIRGHKTIALYTYVRKALKND